MNSIQMEEKLKEKKNRKDYWLHEVRERKRIELHIDLLLGYYC
jgi:hypothetical protein